MQDRYRPAATPAEIREGADQTIARLRSLTAEYQSKGIALTRWHVDPIAGSHANLDVAQDLLDTTNPLRQLTRRDLTLDRLGEYPSIKIFPSGDGSKIGLITPHFTYQFSHQRIETVFNGGFDVPRRVRLLERFGRQTPGQLILKAMEEAQEEARYGRTIFSRFTGRNK